MRRHNDEAGERLPSIQPSPFADLFDAYAGFVWRVLRYSGVAERDLADVSQEVFLVVHRRLAEHDRVRSALRTWIFGIAQNVARNHQRLARVAREVPVAELPEPEPSPPMLDDAIDAARARELIARTLLRLDEGQRTVLVLHDLEAMPMQEIADAEGIPLPTAYSRLRLARKKLDTWLREATSGGES
jgi:RNA polymerase sigma-70 factor (ECF subfamily)